MRVVVLKISRSGTILVEGSDESKGVLGSKSVEEVQGR